MQRVVGGRTGTHWLALLDCGCEVSTGVHFDASHRPNSEMVAPGMILLIAPEGTRRR